MTHCGKSNSYNKKFALVKTSTNRYKQKQTDTNKCK